MFEDNRDNIQLTVELRKANLDVENAIYTLHKLLFFRMLKENALSKTYVLRMIQSQLGISPKAATLILYRLAGYYNGLNGLSPGDYINHALSSLK